MNSIGSYLGHCGEVDWSCIVDRKCHGCSRASPDSRILRSSIKEASCHLINCVVIVCSFYWVLVVIVVYWRGTLNQKVRFSLINNFVFCVCFLVGRTVCCVVSGHRLVIILFWTFANLLVCDVRSRQWYIRCQRVFLCINWLHLFVQVLGDKLKHFCIWLLCLLIPNSTNNSKSVNKFVEWKTIILAWLRNAFQIYAFMFIMVVPKFFVFKHNFL